MTSSQTPSSPSPLPIVIGLNAVILAVTDEEPRILILPRGSSPSTGQHGAPLPEDAAADQREPIDVLPFGPLDPLRDRTLELALRGWVREQTGVEVGYVEQLYTFGDRNRDPREREGGPRVISIGYLTLGREGQTVPGSQAQWRAWYEYFPWEDWRDGRPPILDQRLVPALGAWAAASDEAHLRRQRRERVDIAFGLGGAPWDAYRALDRYELLYEAGLVHEARRDSGEDDRSGVGENDGNRFGRLLGRPMGFDHRRILATALSRLRGKIKYRPVVFELLAPTFTLLQLQRVVEALAGQPLHKQNFRRLVIKGGLVEDTGELTTVTGGRPAKLFRFRRDVLRERPTPGVGLPALPPG